MTQWLYKSLLVFHVNHLKTVEKAKDGTWHVSYIEALTYLTTRDGLLNPQRDWQSILSLQGKHPSGAYILACSEDAGYVDLAEDVIGKLGSDGWELVAIDGWTTMGGRVAGSVPDCCRYVFKKPQP